MTIQELKQYIYINDKITTILEALGMHSIDESNSKYISCGMPNGDNPCSTIIYKDEYLTCNAYTRNIKPQGWDKQTNLFHLIMFINKCEFSSALQWCNTLLGIKNDGKRSTKGADPLSFFHNIKRKREGIKEQFYYDMSILDCYDKTIHIDLIRKDGIISQKVLDKYQVMFDFRSDRIIFPHFKYDNPDVICGVVGRTVNHAFKELNIKKYMSMLPTEYIKTQNLYALCWNEEYIRKFGQVIIFEAEKSVIKADMMEFPIGVSVGCHDISDFQKKILLSLGVEIIIAFDKDVDEEHMQKICRSYCMFGKVSYIYDKWNLLSDKDSPVDRGLKKWKFLYNHRVVWKEYMKLNSEKEE
jgi:DNA primase